MKRKNYDKANKHRAKVRLTKAQQREITRIIKSAK